MMLKLKQSIWTSQNSNEINEQVFRTISSSKSLLNLNIQKLLIGTDDTPIIARFFNFNGYSIDACNFNGSRISCGFINSRIRTSSFENTYFDTCIFNGAHLFQTNLMRSTVKNPTMNDFRIMNCNFDMSKLTGNVLRGFGGRRMEIVGSTFRKCKISGLQFRACTFRECDFTNVVSEYNLFVACKFVDCISVESLRTDSDDSTDRIAALLE